MAEAPTRTARPQSCKQIPRAAPYTVGQPSTPQQPLHPIARTLQRALLPGPPGTADTEWASCPLHTIALAPGTLGHLHCVYTMCHMHPARGTPGAPHQPHCSHTAPAPPLPFSAVKASFPSQHPVPKMPPQLDHAARRCRGHPAMSSLSSPIAGSSLCSYSPIPVAAGAGHPRNYGSGGAKQNDRSPPSTQSHSKWQQRTPTPPWMRCECPSATELMCSVPLSPSPVLWLPGEMASLLPDATRSCCLKNSRGLSGRWAMMAAASCRGEQGWDPPSGQQAAVPHRVPNSSGF